MTDCAQSVLGRAVFGTSRGLAAAGNGVLAGADKCIGVFEFRGRTGPPRQLLDACFKHPAIFCRRAEDAASGGRKIVLVGALRSCLDSQSRPGFFGACVAVPLDTRQRFFDWTSCGDEIGRLFMELAGQVDSESGQLRFAGAEIVSQTRRDEIIKWRAEEGEMLLLHNEGTELEDIEKLPRLQAIAYAQGHRYPTAVAVESAVPGSQSLSADIVTDAMARWDTGRGTSSQGRRLEDEPDAEALRGRDPGRSVEVPDIDWHRIGRLEQAVESLQRSVVKLSRNPVHPAKRRIWEGWFWVGVVLAVGMSAAAVAIALWAMP
ncbi:MAG: hypothetical protein F4213_21665 [Boseongicola sp. SB0677_bin_26]|nr:hypothetical protein [Boseongicola sp. SB0665_bin_10]MYG28589.1 hypothetical protein [Boseongicola sp. SB0677_bin_26]